MPTLPVSGLRRKKKITFIFDEPANHNMCHMPAVSASGGSNVAVTEAICRVRTVAHPILVQEANSVTLKVI